jgi:hypothetical protein
MTGSAVGSGREQLGRPGGRAGLWRVGGKVGSGRGGGRNRDEGGWEIGLGGDGLEDEG